MFLEPFDLAAEVLGLAVTFVELFYQLLLAGVIIFQLIHARNKRTCLLVLGFFLRLELTDKFALASYFTLELLELLLQRGDQLDLFLDGLRTEPFALCLLKVLLCLSKLVTQHLLSSCRRVLDVFLDFLLLLLHLHDEFLPVLVLTLEFLDLLREHCIPIFQLHDGLFRLSEACFELVHVTKGLQHVLEATQRRQLVDEVCLECILGACRFCVRGLLLASLLDWLRRLLGDGFKLLLQCCIL